MRLRMNIGRFAVLLLPLLAACDDPFGPRNWSATPDTAFLYSASRPELIGFVAGFDFTTVPGRPVPVEAAGASQNWDVALVDFNGQLALAPSSYFLGQAARTGIAERPSVSLESVEEAPGDSASYQRVPVPLRLGSIYIIRTRISICESGIGSGTRYAKIQPLAIDQAAGTFRFAYVRNPYCDDRSLIPPDED